MLPATEVQRYKRDGYAVARGLFTTSEVAQYREHFMRLRESGTYPGDTAGVDVKADDPLKRYPRMIHMHRWDQLSLQWLLDPRQSECMAQLVGAKPNAVQTMLYFKPAGARGQALHQDQYYLNAYPGTCIATWLALDHCDAENGCLEVIPGTQDLPILCTTRADTNKSFTDVTVPLAPGMQTIPVIMEPGDVLFFGGTLIHGSNPNVSRDRWRRALIGHYISAEATRVAKFYHPVLSPDGGEAKLDIGQRSEECGRWVQRDGHWLVDTADAQILSGPEHE